MALRKEAGLGSLPALTQKDHLTSTAQACKKQVFQFLILCDLSFLSSTHTINSTCKPLHHHARVSTIDPKLFPQTSLARLEVFLVNAWQGSSPVEPKALSFPSLPKHLSKSTQLLGVTGKESWLKGTLGLNFCPSPRTVFRSF